MSATKKRLSKHERPGGFAGVVLHVLLFVGVALARGFVASVSFLVRVPLTEVRG